MKKLLSVGLALGAVLSSANAHASSPETGQPAPPLTFTHLLQAPEGTSTDWAHLRGKVVVLEFWATWCEGCVEAIPHLNDLIHSLPADKFQFIAVDDEDPTVVRKFLKRTPIDSWVGLDTSHAIIDTYGVKIYPATFIIDREGRIASATSPQYLDRDRLLALAGVKPGDFPVNSATSSQLALKSAAHTTSNSDADDDKPLLEISIRPGNYNGRMTIQKSPLPDGSYTYEMENASLSQFIQRAGNLSKDRFNIVGENKATYSLRVNAPRGEIEQLGPAILVALATATGRNFSRVTTEQEVYLLEATPQSTSLLSRSTSKGTGYSNYNLRDGSLLLMNGSLDKLAHTLEFATGIPILNQTNIVGQFNASLDLPKTDFDSVKAVLEKNVGLTLTKARRPIEHLTLEAQSVVPPTTTPTNP
jgi:thiol-disulfide isomerase/thioredoxin